MNTLEILNELDEIRSRLRKVRSKNSNARWFVELIRGVESLLAGIVKAIEHVSKATK